MTRQILSQLTSRSVSRAIGRLISPLSRYRFSYERTNELTNEDFGSYPSLKSFTKPTRLSEHQYIEVAAWRGAYGARSKGCRHEHV